MPTQLIKQNVYKHASDTKQISLYCCESFTLFQKSFRKMRQLYLTDKAIYIVSRKKLKVRIPLANIIKVYVGLLAGEFFLVSENRNLIIDCTEGRTKFIDNIKQTSGGCQIEYVNYTTLDFLFEKHKKINSKIKLTEYDPNQKKVQLRFFTGQKLNLRQLRLKWQQKMSTTQVQTQNKEKDYELTQVILVNTYWNIFAAKHKSTQKEYTIKVFSKKFIGMQETLLISITNQRKFLQNLTTAYTPSLIKAFYSPSNIYLVCQKFNGYLLEVFKNIKKHKIVNLIAQIVIAVGQLHQAGLVYGNLSRNGVMIGIDGYVFLFNLGLCIEKGKQALPQHLLKPPQYHSNQNAQFGWDWWNLAQLIFQIVEKRHFYDGKNAEQIQNYLRDPNEQSVSCLRAQKLPKDQLLYSLFISLIKKSPNDRLGYKNDYHQILHHKYFQDWLKQHSKTQIIKKQCPPVFKKVINPPYNQSQSKDIQKEFISQQDWSEMNSYLKDFDYSRDIE